MERLYEEAKEAIMVYQSYDSAEDPMSRCRNSSPRHGIRTTMLSLLI